MPWSRHQPVRLRTATQAEHPIVRRVLRAAYRQYQAVLPPDVFERYMADLVDLDGRPLGADLIVAETGGRIAGTATFYADASREGMGWPSRWAGLRALGVHPFARRTGVARRLVYECLVRALRVDAEAICLHSASFMPDAVQLYESIGFNRDPAYDVDAAGFLGIGDGPRITALAYTFPLVPAGRTQPVGAVRFA
jgi:predicted N-acetyltransferase YhbS